MVFNDHILAEKFALETERGYWTVAGKFFFNKAECLKYASTVKNYNVKYSFLDSTYRSLNWRVEPTESMEELYKLRAQQIRSKYDYVFLFYSGGADSTNILDTFMDNNISLDEVVTCYPVSVIEKNMDIFNPTNKDKSNVMFEYVLAVQPKLKELSIRYPNTKITIVDYAELSRNFIIKGNLNKVFQSGLAADPYHTSHVYVAEKMRALSDTKSVCAISGIDKPRLMYDIVTKNFSCYFHDLNTIFGKFSEETLSGYIPKIEYFYYTTDMPTLMQKQCFVLKHALIQKNKLTPASKEIISKVKGNRFIIYNSHTHFFRTTLYPKWNDNTWQADKDTTNYFYQSNSKWFHSNKFTEKKYMDYYEGQVNELINGVDEIFIERSNGKINKFIDFISTPITF